MNAELLLTLAIQAISHAQELATLFQKVKSEGRTELTPAELDSLSGGAKSALDRLRAEIGA